MGAGPVAVSLDGLRMIKDEDAGTFYFDQAEPGLKLPDFRVVRHGCIWWS